VGTVLFDDGIAARVEPRDQPVGQSLCSVPGYDRVIDHGLSLGASVRIVFVSFLFNDEQLSLKIA
jgi:hypothetical protein